MGSWSLIAWQATFYERVYELGSETYAPLLAVIIPVRCTVFQVSMEPRSDNLAACCFIMTCRA